MVTERGSAGTSRLVRVSYPSVFQNLALEETLARSCAPPAVVPVIRLWRNPPSVIVGRFQDVTAEVDVEFCEKNDIAIARRFTGGGAVFHDLGNLNVSIITNRSKALSLTDIYERNAAIVIDLLARYGVEGKLVPPNSIHVNGRKLSGAAAAIGQCFVLWHASVLISTDINKLRRALGPSLTFKRTRSIRSNWQPVTTLTEVIGRSVGINDAERAVLGSCEKILGSRIERSELLEDEIRFLEWLHENKYSLRDWNWNQHWVPSELDRKGRELTQLLPCEFSQRP